MLNYETIMSDKIIDSVLPILQKKSIYSNIFIGQRNNSFFAIQDQYQSI